MVDWQVILTSVITSLVSSSLITAGIVYILKRSIDRVIDYRFEKSMETFRLSAQERTRRQGAIYDKQLGILKEILSLTYRLRNATRDLTHLPSADNPGVDKALNANVKKLQAYHEALTELLLEERALLNPSLFKLAHALHTRAQILFAQAENIRLEKYSMTADELQGAYDSFIEAYPPIDKLYQSMVDIIQGQIGVMEGENS